MDPIRCEDVGNRYLVRATQLIERVLLLAGVMVVAYSGAQLEHVGQLVAAVGVHRPAVLDLVE